MTTYGVYFEFDTDITREGQVHAAVSRAVGALRVNITHLSIETLYSPPVPTHQLVEQPELGYTHDFFDKFDSVGEDNVPDDVFKYPHIKALLTHLGMKEEDDGTR